MKTNREINEAVARKLGWVPVIVGFSPDPIEGAPCQKVALLENTPNYCTDIGAAWEIPISTKKEFYLSYEMDGHILQMTWKAKFRIDATHLVGGEDKHEASMAICLAFLKLSSI